MNDVVTSNEVNKKEVLSTSRIGLTSNAPPKVSQTDGVSTRNALTPSTSNTKSIDNIPHWYVLRCTYGQERKAYEYIINHQGVAYYPTIREVKDVNGKRKIIEVSRIPNIFFAYGTEEIIKSFVYDNVNLPFLRFYYEYYHVGNKSSKRPLIVPQEQMDSLKIICTSETEDIIVTLKNVPKFKSGEFVRVVQGKFTGVVGRVARYQGQQRVAVVVDGLLTVATAYIPTAFLEPYQVK